MVDKTFASERECALIGQRQNLQCQWLHRRAAISGTALRLRPKRESTTPRRVPINCRALVVDNALLNERGYAKMTSTDTGNANGYISPRRLARRCTVTPTASSTASRIPC